jgi:hypothetical protein
MLGYSPNMSLDAGLRRTLDWCLQMGLIPGRRVVA